ncbi:DUF4382 domain-containing protein [Shewanella algae]|uniref:DUF4382 domain-containing protein n=1 Tax=Shewanella algae TaxID=38313 RepID=UPI001687D8D6|nr:DUF4382 domain-containing protein [Shewanella algae]EKT4489904.1 DUF4382 domain-containing protein [Shewanella algae]MBO2548788.1 DUF4382 domain-containing protein [Shewanella algae]MBO2570348.1 DUF4382 domain-containing protein [Shewanella algae]MBO2663342.1 DUF4382 domain-containing protein [Shewanella algae]MCL1053382.1 DUF4382 domain-containing protein [Shewanella algae]
MKNRISTIALLCGSGLLLAACGGSDNDTPPTPTPDTAKVSFAVSDAPVDSAEKVVVAFDKIELVRAGQDNIILEVSGPNGEDYRQLDLLEYQGSDSALILSDAELEVGTYSELILHVLDESVGSDLSYVIDETGQVPLKQPSNKLRLGSFEVGSAGVQRFTIEFDLRRSLVENQNGQRYNLKPHGVTIVDNATVASLSGQVDINLFNAGECAADSGNFVYLYPGHDLDPALLTDNLDPDVNQNAVPEGAVVPYNSVEVEYEVGNFGKYAFGFIPAGDYTVAFSCSAENDDPEQYDGLIIPNPAPQLHQVTLSNQTDTVQDFNAVVAQ